MTTTTSTNNTSANTTSTTTNRRRQQQQQEVTLYKLPFKPQIVEFMDTNWYTLGNINLLQSLSAAVLTSTNAGKQGLLRARRFPEWLAAQETTLIIDGLNIEDMPSINAMLENGGNVIIFLPLGLQLVDLNPFAEYIKIESVLVMAQSLNKPWSIEEATSNNEIIAKTADVLYVPEVQGTYKPANKSWAGGVPNQILLFIEEKKPIFFPSSLIETPYAQFQLACAYPESITVLRASKDADIALQPVLEALCDAKLAAEKLAAEKLAAEKLAAEKLAAEALEDL